MALGPYSQRDLCSASSFEVQRIRPRSPGGFLRPWVGQQQMDSPLLHTWRDLPSQPCSIPPPSGTHKACVGEGALRGVSGGQRRPWRAEGLGWWAEGAPREGGHGGWRWPPKGKGNQRVGRVLDDGKPSPEVRQGPWKSEGSG